MNLIHAIGTYIGEAKTEDGIRCMEVQIPGGSPKQNNIPLFLLGTFAAGDTFVPDAYEKGSSILFSGRPYPYKDNRMYIAPTLPLQAAPGGLSLNQVFVSGGVGFIADHKMDKLFECGILCQAVPQKMLGYTWDDSLGFRVNAWGEDAARLRKFFFKGRQVAINAALRYETWENKNKEARARYSLTVRSGQYAFFGKNKAAQPAVEMQQKAPDSDRPAPLATVIPKAIDPTDSPDNIPF
tara:strand:+ start:279 stop:995 length:717 start_codon:yes stop_codon:yes gene_type:complete